MGTQAETRPPEQNQAPSGSLLNVFTVFFRAPRELWPMSLYNLPPSADIVSKKRRSFSTEQKMEAVKRIRRGEKVTDIAKAHCTFLYTCGSRVTFNYLTRSTAFLRGNRSRAR